MAVTAPTADMTPDSPNVLVSRVLIEHGGQRVDQRVAEQDGADHLLHLLVQLADADGALLPWLISACMRARETAVSAVSEPEKNPEDISSSNRPMM